VGVGISALAVSGSNIFAGTNGHGVYLSTTNGTSWSAVDSGLSTFISPVFVLPDVVCLVASGGNIFAGTVGNGLFLSTNNGASWSAVDSGLGPKFGTAVLSLAMSGNNIFAGTDNGVFLSTNNGTNWTSVNNGIISSIEALAVNGNNIYAGGNNGVYLSVNNGTSWTAVSSGLPATTAVQSLAVSGNNIFAGTNDGGVFLSTNNGTSWTAVNDGLPVNAQVRTLAVIGSNIFAGIAGQDGLNRRPLSEMVGVINTNPQQGMLKPYAGGFKINITKNNIAVLLPGTLNSGAITVELVNIAGRMIYSATHQSHNGNLNIPISGLSTGIYLMSIAGRNITKSSSFVVTK
jgi:photosystem II stability/assembly factor-like uncharacterized protein